MSAKQCCCDTNACCKGAGVTAMHPDVVGSATALLNVTDLPQIAYNHTARYIDSLDAGAATLASFGCVCGNNTAPGDFDAAAGGLVTCVGMSGAIFDENSVFRPDPLDDLNEWEGASVLYRPGNSVMGAAPGRQYAYGYQALRGFESVNPTRISGGGALSAAYTGQQPILLNMPTIDVYVGGACPDASDLVTIGFPISNMTGHPPDVQGQTKIPGLPDPGVPLPNVADLVPGGVVVKESFDLDTASSSTSSPHTVMLRNTPLGGVQGFKSFSGSDIGEAGVLQTTITVDYHQDVSISISDDPAYIDVDIDVHSVATRVTVFDEDPENPGEWLGYVGARYRIDTQEITYSATATRLRLSTDDPLLVACPSAPEGEPISEEACSPLILGPCCNGVRVCGPVDPKDSIAMRLQLLEGVSVSVGVPITANNAAEVLAVSGSGYAGAAYPEATTEQLDAVALGAVETVESVAGAECDPTGDVGVSVSRSHPLLGFDDSGAFAYSGRETLASLFDGSPDGRRIGVQWSIEVQANDSFRHRVFSSPIPLPTPGVPLMLARINLVYDKSLAAGLRVVTSASVVNNVFIPPDETASSENLHWRGVLGSGLFVEGAVGGWAGANNPCASHVNVLLQGYQSLSQVGTLARMAISRLEFFAGYDNLAECAAGGGGAVMMGPPEPEADGLVARAGTMLGGARKLAGAALRGDWASEAVKAKRIATCAACEHARGARGGPVETAVVLTCGRIGVSGTASCGCVVGAREKGGVWRAQAKGAVEGERCPVGKW